MKLATDGHATAPGRNAISQMQQRPLPSRRKLPVAVGRHGGVLLAVGQQQFDHIAPEPMLAQQGRRRAARPMRTEVGHAEIDASGCAGFTVTSSLRIACL